MQWYIIVIYNTCIYNKSQYLIFKCYNLIVYFIMYITNKSKSYSYYSNIRVLSADMIYYANQCFFFNIIHFSCIYYKFLLCILQKIIKMINTLTLTW